MNKFAATALGVAAVVVIAIVGVQVLRPQMPDAGDPTGAPSLAPSGTIAPSVAPSIAAEIGLPRGHLALDTPQVPITVTIPASGWEHVPEFNGVSKGVEVSNLPEAFVMAWTYPAGTGFYVYGDPCQWQSTTPDTPATTVDDFVTRLAAQGSRDASEPVDVTVGGYSGKRIILHVPDDAVFADCDEDAFASYGTDPTLGLDGVSRHHQGPGQVDELWILDMGGAMLVIDAMSRPDTSAALIDEMRAIAQSATFE